MAAIDVVNRVFREFKRYTGDGLPGEPLNAPLPEGDKTSGPHSPKKSELRAALLEPLVEIEEGAERAEAAADRAEAAAALSGPTAVASGRLSGDGSQTVFNLPVAPPSAAHLILAISGILQDLDAYSVSGVQVTFSEAPPVGTNNISWRVVSLSEGEEVPPNGSVTKARMANNAVGANQIDAAESAAIKAKLGISEGGTPAVGYFHGLKLANSGSHGITISPGEAASDASTPIRLILAAAMTKLLNTAWAAGSGNGGLDTGAVATGTYHLWLIGRSSDGAVDALFSLSPTSPTMPSGWDRKVYLWPVVRGASGNVAFWQKGSYFLLASPAPTPNTAIGTVSALITLPQIPLGVSVLVDMQASVFSSNANSHAYLSSPSATDAVPAAGTYSSIVTLGNSAYSSGHFRLLTDNAARIRHRASIAISNFTIVPIGWEFAR